MKKFIAIMILSVLVLCVPVLATEEEYISNRPVHVEVLYPDVMTRGDSVPTVPHDLDEKDFKGTWNRMLEYTYTGKTFTNVNSFYVKINAEKNNTTGRCRFKVKMFDKTAGTSKIILDSTTAVNSYVKGVTVRVSLSHVYYFQVLLSGHTDTQPTSGSILVSKRN